VGASTHYTHTHTYIYIYTYMYIYTLLHTHLPRPLITRAVAAPEDALTRAVVVGPLPLVDIAVLFVFDVCVVVLCFKKMIWDRCSVLCVFSCLIFLVCVTCN
jgi:hypothetical protein